MAVSTVEDTGNGATFTLGTTTFAVRIKKIGGLELKGQRLDVSNLSSTGYMKSIPGDLKETPEVTVDFYFDTTKQLPTINGTPETGTITFPVRANGGEVTAANIAGTGFFTMVKTPDLANGEVQMGSFTFTFDGATGPTFTISSAT